MVLEDYSRYSNWATGWMVWVSSLSQGKRIFSSQKHPDQLWAPHSLLFSGYVGAFLEVKQQGMKLTAHLHLVLMLIITGVIPLLHLYACMMWICKT
jgi:hypothetical protein